MAQVLPVDDVVRCLLSPAACVFCDSGCSLRREPAPEEEYGQRVKTHRALAGLTPGSFRGVGVLLGKKEVLGFEIQTSFSQESERQRVEWQQVALLLLLFSVLVYPV